MANEALRLIGSSAPGGAEQRDDELNLRELWRAVMRRKFVLLATMIVVTGAAYAYISQQTPLYTAKALIQIQNRDAQVIQIDGIVDELIADPATIATEIEYLTSPAFSRRIVEQLDLVSDPEFNPSLNPEAQQPSLFEILNPMRYIPEEWLSMFSGGSTSDTSPVAAALPGIDPEEAKLNRIVGRVSSGMEVLQVGGSYVIELTFTSEDPVKAALIANVMADEYLVSQVEAKFEAAERATTWLSKRIQELRGDVLEAEAKIVEYRSRNNLVDTDTNNPVTLQFFQLNSQMALAQAETRRRRGTSSVRRVPWSMPKAASRRRHRC